MQTIELSVQYAQADTAVLHVRSVAALPQFPPGMVYNSRSSVLSMYSIHAVGKVQQQLC